MRVILAAILAAIIEYPSVAPFNIKQINDIVPANKFLFSASISNDFEHICSATILNKWWIITSAICIASYEPGELKVYYGSHNRTHDGKTQDTVEIIVLHPAFDAERLLGNLALIKVQNHITFIPTVVQAVTISVIDPVENDVVFAVAWERHDDSNDSDRPEMLKYYKTKVAALDICCKPSVSYCDSIEINEQIICTHSTIENTLMPFDSGSALVSAVESKLIGIALWNNDDIPNAYVKIRTFMPWIRSVIFGQAMTQFKYK